MANLLWGDVFLRAQGKWSLADLEPIGYINSDALIWLVQGDGALKGKSLKEIMQVALAQAREGRLHILEVQRLIRFMPKIVICVVPGWAAGGGHSLHVVADLTLASKEHARFKQTDADVGSFDGGYGSAYLAKMVGQKFAREIFFLGDEYDAEAAQRISPNLLSFMGESRRLSNHRIKRELRLKLRYPTVGDGVPAGVACGANG